MILFFDDQDLEGRKNFNRKYEAPQYLPESCYRDPSDFGIGAGLPSVVYSDELEEYVMIYNIVAPNDFPKLPLYLCAAHSKDLIHWEPLDTTKYVDIPDRALFNQIFEKTNGEAWIYEDRRAKKAERYKMFFCGYGAKCRMIDEIYVSPDLFHWTKLDSTWNRQGAEPGICCVYSEKLKKYVITCRPHWGDRRVCYVTTEDFRTFSPVTHCLQMDSMDEATTDAYGLYAFEYERYTIGLLWKYFRPNGIRSITVGNQLINALGRMYPELTYSFNGTNHMRSLRTPFIDNGTPEDPFYGCLFTSAMIKKDGKIYIISAALQCEHGGFRDKGTGAIVTHVIDEDRFIYLESEGYGNIITRNLLINGPISVNANVYSEMQCRLLDTDMNVLEGYDFEDFDKFNGNETNHVLTWHGKDTSVLKGKSLLLEVSILGGRLYAIKGDFMILRFNQNRLYENYGIIEEEI